MKRDIWNYNFERLVDRKGTDSFKWDATKLLFGKENLLPLWVADMDFEVCDEVQEAVCEKINHGVYGYSVFSKNYKDSVVNWFKRRHNWEFSQDAILYYPGIVPFLHLAVEALTEPNDAILIHSPVYHPFRNVVVEHNRVVVESELINKGNSYEMDFEDMAKKIDEQNIKLLIFCSPHNPGGRVWSKAELTALGELCLERGVTIISDEIHCDIVFNGNIHTPLANINKDISNIVITCTSVSKAFNTAGFPCANMIVENPTIREILSKAIKMTGFWMPEYLTSVIVQSCYNKGELWLDEMCDYVEENIEYINAFFSEKLVKSIPFNIEGTYLAWIDISEYAKNKPDYKDLLVKEGVALSYGEMFGEKGAGFIRINAATPFSLLETALEKIKKAICST